MKCVLTVPGAAGDAGDRVSRCLPLLPILDRPFLQHVIEHLAGRGVTDVHIVVGRHADAVERFLGDGARWGCRFTYHLTREPVRPGRVFRSLASTLGDEPVLLGRADELPPLPPDLVGRAGELFDADGGWTGWAVAAPADLTAVPAAAAWADLSRHLADRGATLTEVGRPLRLRSLEDVTDVRRALLGGEFPGAFWGGRQVLPGVWVGRNVSLPASAEVFAPVFIGENTAVGHGAKLGPFTAVGADCLLDAGCEVRDASVLPGSYVGPGVGLHGVIVEGRTLINPSRRVAVSLDPHLLDGLSRASVASAAAQVAERAAAAGVLVLGLPVLAAAAVWLKLTRPGPVFWPRRFVRGPGSAQESNWREAVAYTLTPPQSGESETGWVLPPTLPGLVLELLPALAAVARGHLRLVGLTPRPMAALRDVPADRREVLAGAPVGLVSEAGLCRGPELATDDVLIADTYQACSSTPLANLARFTRFVVRALTTWHRPAVAPVVAPAGPESMNDTAEMEPLHAAADTTEIPVVKKSDSVTV